MTSRRDWLLGLVALSLPCILYALPLALATGVGSWPMIPAEPLALAILFLLLPQRPARLLLLPAALLATLAGLALLLDLGTWLFLGRASTPFLDALLLPNLFELVQGALGFPATIALLGAAVLTALLLFFLVRWSLSRLARLNAPPVALIAGLPLLLVLAPALSAELSYRLGGQVERSFAMLEEQSTFGQRARQDDLAADPPHDPFGRLGDADVIVVFVESYGRAALDDPRYADRTSAALDRLQSAAEAEGFKTLSGWSDSPTLGGQSWLAHGSFLSGLWLDNQIRYNLAFSSGRQFLPHFLSRDHRESALVMPAIVRPWPEGKKLGFDRMIFAEDLGYAGKPYNWVTMPDQYTLYRFERDVRRPGKRPLFALLALISSHAPWTPIAPVLEDWSSIGDGEVFSEWADAGDPPQLLWQDPERVREHYALSIDYVLRSLAAYLEWMERGPFLMIVLGDHEAGTIISDSAGDGLVPVHLIASDAEFLEPFARRGYTKGVKPAADGAALPMNAFRDFLLQAYAGGLVEAAVRP